MTNLEPRATEKDWLKAFACSLAVLLLLLLFWMRPSRTTGEDSPPPELAAAEVGTEGLIGLPEEEAGGIGTGDGAGGSGEGEGTVTGFEGTGKGGLVSDEVSDSGTGVATEYTPIGGLAAVAAEGESETTNVEEPPPPEEAASPEAPVGVEPEVVDDPNEGQVPQPVQEIAMLAPVVPGSKAPPKMAGPVAKAGLSGKAGAGAAGRNVGGMMIRGGSLGVILDVSGSMTPYLQKLRQEIGEQFSDAVFLEVIGCSLHPLGAGFEHPDPLPQGAIRNSVMEALHELVSVHGVDAVYWFCDLQDSRLPEAVHEMREMVAGKLLSKGSPSKGGGGSGFSGLDDLERMNEGRSRPLSKPVFRLYIRSTDQSPDAALQKVITESGGEFQKKK